MFKKILVGIDASAEIDYAFADALTIAKATGADLNLLHVFSWDDAYDKCRAMLYSELKESEQSEAIIEHEPVVECMLSRYRGYQQSNVLMKYKTAAESAGVHAELEPPRRGRPGRNLCDAARTEKADLIAVGHRDKDFGKKLRLNELRLGSVSHEVIHNAPCSVFISHRSEAGAGGLADTGRILAALDDSEMSQLVFQAALDLAKATGANLTLINVLSPSKKKCPLATLEALKDKADIVGVSVSIEQIDSEDDSIGKTICKFADEKTFDLILVGRRKLLEVQEMLLGSVSHYIGHHAPCGVIIVQASQLISEELLFLGI